MCNVGSPWLTLPKAFDLSNHSLGERDLSNGLAFGAPSMSDMLTPEVNFYYVYELMYEKVIC